jgi:hypothetical protein
MQLCFASPRSSVALFVLFLLEVVPRHPSARIAPRLLDDALLPRKAVLSMAPSSSAALKMMRLGD